jgi:fructokinase
VKDANVDVVCFGEILWDIYETSARGDDAIARNFRRELGGAPANVAVGLARVGVKSAMCGGIGRDRLGDALANFLERDQVSTRFLIRLPNRTGIVFVTRDARGEPSFLFYRHETADVSIELSHLTPEMARAKFVLVGTSTLMTPNLRAATYRLIDLATSAGASIVVDLNVRAHLWKSEREMHEQMAKVVRHASIVKASAADLALIVGSSEIKGISWLRKSAPNATWLITRSDKPANAIGAHGDVRVAAKRAKCVDATGAGDAFLAGVLATLIAFDADPKSKNEAWRDQDVWTRALQFGHILGAKAVSRAGSVSGLVGLQNVKRELASISQHLKKTPNR